MGIQHHFSVIKNVSIGLSELYVIVRNKEFDLGVDDETISYIVHSLNWIETYNPAKKQKTSGLNYSGMTTIVSENLTRLTEILSTWRTLFGLAPTTDISLRGSFVFGENPREWTYRRDLYRKTDLLDQIDALISVSARSKNVIYWPILGHNPSTEWVQMNRIEGFALTRKISDTRLEKDARVISGTV